MATYIPSEERESDLVRCGVCGAIVITEVACARADGNTVCTACGLTQVASPFEGCDYFEFMKVGRPLGRAQRRFVARDTNQAR